ncbi:MAG: hypothetical protein J6Y60_02255 [Treponema sp.]|nr:hypothetical protein [Treponema sp.]
MAKKKILLFIVEGQTDSYAFDSLLSSFFEQYRIHFHEISGDILTKFYQTKSPKQSIGDAVNDFLDRYNFTSKDVLFKVVQLIDTDGCYAPNSCISYNADYTYEKGCYYTDTQIETDNVEKKIERNERKRKAVDTLISLQKKVVLRTIPYEIYYFSCNREHALYGVNNLTSVQKSLCAEQFRKTYENNFAGFISLLQSVYPPVAYEFDASWTYLKEGYHSLERCSNFYLFFLANMMINMKKQYTYEEICGTDFSHG